MGDCIHQRAVIRELSQKYKIYLETSWPQIYWDMPEVCLINKGTKLRTQLKNQSKNLDGFKNEIPEYAERLKIEYKPDAVRKYTSVLRAMARTCGITHDNLDYSFPVKSEWVKRAREIAYSANKPILIYRPLVERREWGGCQNRNPDKQAYKELFDYISCHFFVISIADLEDGKEWQVSLPIEADLEFHKGELSFEEIAGLFSIADMVYCSPGFSVVLGKSIKTPVICLFGGYENSGSFSMGIGQFLGVDTERPCNCFSHHHKCNKNINIDLAKEKIKEFMDAQTSASRNIKKVY